MSEENTTQRSSNWSAEEQKYLVDKYMENKEVLEGRFSATITNEDRVKKWQEIAASVSALGVGKRTWQQCKKKHANLISTAKKVHNNYKQECKKTGGGPHPASPPKEISEIIDLNKDRPSFSGIPDNFDFFTPQSDEKSDEYLPPAYDTQPTMLKVYPNSGAGKKRLKRDDIHESVLLAEEELTSIRKRILLKKEKLLEKQHQLINNQLELSEINLRLAKEILNRAPDNDLGTSSPIQSPLMRVYSAINEHLGMNDN